MDFGNSLNWSEKKRVNEGDDGRDSEGKKLRILEGIDVEFGVLEAVGSKKKERVENAEKEINSNGMEVSCTGGLYTCEETRMDFDINAAIIDLEDDEPVHIVADRRIEIIDIPSDESEDEELKVIAGEDFKGRGKKLDGKSNYDSFQSSYLGGLGLMEGNFGGYSCTSDGRRYSREEKGKAKAVDSWLSLTTSPTEFELQQGILDLTDFVVQPGSLGSFQFEAQLGIEDSLEFEALQGMRVLGGIQDSNDFELLLGTQESSHFELLPGPWDSNDLESQQHNQDSIKSSQSRDNIHQLASSVINEEQERRRAQLQLQIEWERERHLDRLRVARTFARADDHDEASPRQEKTPLGDETLLGKSPGPFFAALKIVRDRKFRKNEQNIEWKPSSNDCNAYRTPVPSLLDLSLKALAENAEAIVSLELVPDFLRRKISDSICNLRGMNIQTFELFVKGSPTEMRIKDSSWLTQEQFVKIFRNFDANNLTVLQLELCGQCTLDDHVIGETFTQISKSLSNLREVSLKGACRLSDNGLKALVTSTPVLKSINLSQCSLLTNIGINILADSLGSILREIYISDCHRIDPMLILPALKKFECLEVLSVAGIQTVSDQFVHDLITSCGKSIKALDLADCLHLTNSSLRVIGDTCTGLHSLNISNLDKLTDLGLEFLANGCRYIQTLNLCRNKFSDEAIAAFLEAAGESLKELSLNNVSLVGPSTAFSLAKCLRKLVELDLSWCRKITNEALGLIVDSCSSLKLVKLFGCTQITNIFTNGHSNPQATLPNFINPAPTGLVGFVSLLKVFPQQESYLTRTLTRYSTDLTELARLGKLDPVLCGDGKMKRCTQIHTLPMNKKQRCYYWRATEPGVGKTAIVEGLAQLIVKNNVRTRAVC